MTIDRKDFEESEIKRKEERDQGRLFAFHGMAREAVKAEFMTSDENWDLYLSYIQGLIKNAESQIEPLKSRLIEGNVFDHVELLLLKNEITRLGERLHVLNFVIALPKQVIENGKKAKKYVEKFE